MQATLGQLPARLRERIRQELADSPAPRRRRPRTVATGGTTLYRCATAGCGETNTTAAAAYRHAHGEGHYSIVTVGGASVVVTDPYA